jgi:predicted TIM-barrel fold metal-dependent hydrolase
LSILKRSKCTPPYRWDTHHHILAPEYVSALRNLGIRGATGMPFPEWTPKGTLRFMDRHGIATAIVSVSTPGVHFKPPSVSRDLARCCNEYAARLVGDHPDRFSALASLPLPDVDGALQELAYALDVLSLDGVILLTNAQGQYLGVPELESLFVELNRREAVVLVHPTDPPWGSTEGLDFPNALLESPFETTRAVANLLYSGVLTRFPDIRFILSHAGGTIPFLAWKLSLAHQSQATGVRRLKWPMTWRSGSRIQMKASRS